MKRIFFPIFILTLSFLYGFAPRELAPLETAVLQKDYQHAKMLASTLLKQGISAETADEARYYLGLSYLHLKEYSRAKALFRALAEKVKRSDLRDKVYLGLCDAYYLNEQYVKAEKSARELLKLSPDSNFLSMIYFKLARINLKLTHWDEAHAQLNKIIREFPQSMDVYAARKLLEEKKYFGVQVGSFLDRALSEKLVQDLRQKGDYAYIVETVDQQKRKFYRVRIGQLTALNKARQLKARLSRQGYPARIFP